MRPRTNARKTCVAAAILSSCWNLLNSVYTHTVRQHFSVRGVGTTYQEGSGRDHVREKRTVVLGFLDHVLNAGTEEASRRGRTLVRFRCVHVLDDIFQ